MAASRRLSALAAGLLVASLGMKLAVGGVAPPGVEAQLAADDRSEAKLTAFLQRQGFGVRRETAQAAFPVLLAEAGDCQLLAALVAPQGWHRDLIRQLAGQDRRSFFVFDGVVHAEQPVWRGWAEHYRSVLNRYAGRSLGARPVVAVVALPACDLPAAMWQDFARMPDEADAAPP